MKRWKLICRKNHWIQMGGRVILETPTGKDEKSARALVEVLEKQIRNTVYEEICAIQLAGNRKAIMKYGIENALLAIQDQCAKIALYGIKPADSAEKPKCVHIIDPNGDPNRCMKCGEEYK